MKFIKVLHFKYTLNIEKKIWTKLMAYKRIVILSTDDAMKYSYNRDLIIKGI
jgi:hypothetical protein